MLFTAVHAIIFVQLYPQLLNKLHGKLTEKESSTKNTGLKGKAKEVSDLSREATKPIRERTFHSREKTREGILINKKEASRKEEEKDDHNEKN